MAYRRTPIPGAHWSVRELQVEEKIAIYNRKKNADGHLKMLNDQVYSGLLRFTCSPEASNIAKSHDLHVTSEMTCGDVIPVLCRHLSPHLNGIADLPRENFGCISLVQGEMERVLEDGDKPLQIALDCSTKGLASPKFVFRPPSDHSDGISSHRMRTSHFTSYVGALTTHSNPNLAEISSSFPTANQSPHLPTNLDHHRWLSTDGEQNSLYDSCNSLSSGGHTARKQHMSKSVTALDPKSSPQKKKSVQILSDSGEHNTPPTSTLQLLQPPAAGSSSPFSQGKLSRAKISVGNIFTRSLRVPKKLKSKGKLSKSSSIDNGIDSGSQGSLFYIPPTSPEEKEASAKLSGLASPMLAEQRLTMSTVMYIYYRDAREALSYKSLLVSQKADAQEVVTEALKRFDMTTADPNDFSLYVVVGQWQDVSQSVENEAQGAALNDVSLILSPRPAITSIEEFVVCYLREIDSHECPYNLQFYFAMQEGYTQRFELRQRGQHIFSQVKSQSYEVLDTKRKHELAVEEITPKRLSWANAEVFCKGNSPLFGDTSHRTREKRHPKVTESLSSAVLEGSETEEDILDEKMDREREVSILGEGGEEVVSKVKLRRGKVRKARTDQLSVHVDEAGSCVVEVSTIDHPHPRQALLSATSSSPDSGVVSFKDKKPQHDQEEFLSTTDQLYKTTDAQISTHTSSTTSSPAHLKTAFLLNLKIHNPERELLIEPLEATTVHFTVARDNLNGIEANSAIQHVYLHHPDLSHTTQPLCSIQLQTDGVYLEEDKHFPASKVYILHPTHPTVLVHLNGNLVAESIPLSHGDLLSICNERFLFLFQDYSSLFLQPSQRYSWRPQPLNHLMPSSPPVIGTPPPSSPIVREVRSASPERNHRDVACQTPTPLQGRRHTTSDEIHLEHNEGKQVRSSSADSPHRRGSATPTKNAEYNSLKRPKKSHHHPPLSSSGSSISSTKSSPPCKSLFSFNLSEEGDVLRYLVSDLDVDTVSCYLGPALLLAMCTEYCHKCHGPAATSGFLQKTVDSLQEVVWDCTKKLTKWKPDPTMASRPLSHCEDLFPLLRPTVFWMANALELHHLLNHSCSPFTNQLTKQGENPMNTLHDILVYTFQQMFYTVSKVLYHSLPLLLNGQRGGKKRTEGVGKAGDEVVEQAVDFLQALLDLMTDLHLHLEVVSCFYANLFFFINTALLNSMMKFGPKRGLFTHSIGATLRSSLTLLEGWACQVGFKDAVLHHLAKLSSLLDILATPPHQLVQLSWDELRDEFPVLHPAQLHLILSRYILPSSLSTPSHWTPTPTDTSSAHKTTCVRESYDRHPGFTLPTGSYMLQLNKIPPQQAEFQALVDDLRATLKHNSIESVDVVPIVESAPSAQVPTLLTDITTSTSPSHHNHHLHHVNGNARGDDRQEVTPGRDDDRIEVQTRSTKSHSHDHLTHSEWNYIDVSVIGSNTESQEDLLDKNRRNQHNTNVLAEKSNSGSKVADLISSYEESAKLSQSSSDSVKGSVMERREKTETGAKGRVGRVVSMVTERSFQPQTLVLQEVDGGDDCILVEWEPSMFPDGAHPVNIQRGDKGFGINLVEQKDPITGDPAIYVQHIQPGSTADQCNGLNAGDKVLAIDGRLLDGADYLIAEKYLKEAEDDVQLVLAPRPRTLYS